ncbi:MAG: hypothetical protein LBR06_07870 [Bacteroidales bacterium]|nr:hypothetical protein [Bacteroidales bacterium]
MDSRRTFLQKVALSGLALTPVAGCSRSAVPPVAPPPPQAAGYCCIEVTEEGSGWPVPLVELKTVHQQRFVTDNAGRIALDAPELMGRETWFEVVGYGYSVKADGYGYQGFRLTPDYGKTLKIAVRRDIKARRIGRLTGAGLFGESQKTGDFKEVPESGVFGCDSIQSAIYNEHKFWIWGDTSIAKYPLGIFDASAATTAVMPFTAFEPPLNLPFRHFRDSAGQVRGVAPISGSGPTWLSGLVSLPDSSGRCHLCAMYAKITPPLSAYECGLCVWNDTAERFERIAVIWSKSAATPACPLMPDGHPALWTDSVGHNWALFGNPLPTMRCPATFEAWRNPRMWEPLTPQEKIPSADARESVKPHSGSIAWNSFRKRWVTVFVQHFGKPAAFGEVWYAEADTPTGEWHNAIKILSHGNYTFYNPRIHPDCTPDDAPFLLFEGTFASTFADKPAIVPRYDYNQLLYRFDLPQGL